jgi:hypothetical protein
MCHDFGQFWKYSVFMSLLSEMNMKTDVAKKTTSLPIQLILAVHPYNDSRSVIVMLIAQ